MYNTKICVYRDCKNTNITTKDVTFFGFPLKDMEKCQLWSRLAGCENENLRNKYLCEVHFSHNYISRTARRAVLLTNAVPFRFDEVKGNADEDDINLEKMHSKEPNNDETNDDISYMDTEIEMLYTDRGNRRSSTALDEGHELIKAEDRPISPKKRLESVEDTILITPPKKLTKIAITRNPSHSEYKHVTKRPRLQATGRNLILPNLIKSSIASKKSTENYEKDHESTAEQENEIEVVNVNEIENDERDDDKNNPIDNTVGNPDITTFIFKGEEYIQMPKRIYIQQREKLDADIKRFRHILRNIKELVNNFD